MSLTVSEVAELQPSRYFNVVGMTILIFDYVITLGDEARWVWGRRWDLTRIAFTISRYLPFLGMAMTAYFFLRTSLYPCGTMVEVNIVHMLSILAAEVLLILRTYAFWQGDKRVLFGLSAFGGVTLGASIAIDVARTQLIQGGQTPGGCFSLFSRNNTFVYLILLVFEMVILFLTAFKRFYCYREVKTTIVRTIYRDGMFYIVCIILITFANLLINAISPLQFISLLELPQVSLTSVLASRIMFNLRKSSCQPQRGETDQVTMNDITYSAPLPSELQYTGLALDGWGSRRGKNICDDAGVELA